VAPAAPIGQRQTQGQAGLDQQHGSDWQLETLLHAVMECPAVQLALQWLARLCGAGPAPPLSPEVWPQDSPATWRPAPGSGELWAHLRLAVLEAAWRLPCRRQVTGQQFAAADVVDDVINGVERAVRVDWHSAKSDAPELGGASTSWFPGRGQPLSLSGFELRWCGGGVVARVVHAAAALLTVPQ
jgi:hypothetical protein